MFEVSVYLTSPSVSVSQLAGRLGGICTEGRNITDGIEQKYNFGLDSFADQFNFSAFHFPEVISIGRSPSPIQQAIANSRLCDCGWTTKQACSKTCEAIADQALELQQKFPTLEQIRICHE
jgi:hypothetical protein